MMMSYSTVIMIKILIMAGQDALMPPGGGKSETSLGKFSSEITCEFYETFVENFFQDNGLL